MKNLWMVLAITLVATSALSADGKTKLTLWSYQEGDSPKVLQQLIGEFNASQGQAEVVYEYVPFANFKQKLTVSVMAQDMADIVIIDNPDNAAYAALGAFADISDLVAGWEGKDKFYPGPWKSTQYNGRQYGIPMDSNDLALYYDKKALKKAGLKVPTTWDELKIAAKKLSSGPTFGLAISAPKTEEGTFQYIPWILSTGADVTKVNTPQAVKSLAFLRGLIADKSMSPEVINWTQGDVQKQFSAGKAAMMVNGPWNIGSIKRDSPDLDFGVTLIPRDKQFSSVLGGENLAITKAAKRDAAWAFVKWFGSKEIENKYNALTGTFPSRSDAIAVNDVWTKDPVLAAFLDEMKYAMPRGPHPRWPELSNALSEALQKGLIEVSTPQAALDEAQAKIDKVLK
jgi:multiple sugar transport system substrate-binding protein